MIFGKNLVYFQLLYINHNKVIKNGLCDNKASGQGMAGRGLAILDRRQSGLNIRTPYNDNQAMVVFIGHGTLSIWYRNQVVISLSFERSRVN